MKALTLADIGRVAYQEVPSPGLVDDTDAIIPIRHTAICRSDLLA
ncbi:MAG: hypothetical protein OWU33_12000 [Firmicutes bacterium]|nr:hypothetical protein [Bacillota bacterium]